MVVHHDLSSKPRSRFRYWFHHPTTRILNVLITSGLSCVLFSKDPIGYSPAEAQIPILGSILDLSLVSVNLMMSQVLQASFSSIPILSWIQPSSSLKHSLP